MSSESRFQRAVPGFLAVPALMFLLMGGTGCHSEAVREMKAFCSAELPVPAEKEACKKGVDFGIADWNTTRDLSSIRREEIEASLRKALERCHDRYPGGFDQLPIRTACQRGVRRVREYALGQLELFQGRAPSLRGSRGATGSDSSVSETARKSYEIDAERLRQIQESFRNRGGGGSPPSEPAR
jgi:hypothetical protein